MSSPTCAPAPNRSIRGRIAAASALVATLIVAVFRIERTTALDDAAQYWMMADRLAETGQPFYVGAVDHKGPLWLAAFRLARMITGNQDWYWFLIAAQAMFCALVIAVCVRVVIRAVVGDRPIATVTAGAALLLLLFGPEPYSDILFGRNITAAMTAVAVALIVRVTRHETEGGLHTRSFMAAGALCGLATQTVLTTAAPTAALAVGIIILSTRVRTGVARSGIFGISSLLAFASAPLWYWSIGVGDAFKLYFWDYNQLYASDAGGSLSDRISTAMGQVTLFHLWYPIIVPISIALVLPALWERKADAPRFNRKQRLLTVMLLWWCSELVSVVAPGRFFRHYWILQVAPGAIIVALAWVRLHDRFVNSGAERALRIQPAQASGAIGNTLRNFHHYPASMKAMFLPLLLVAGLAVPSVALGVDSLTSWRGTAAHGAERDADWTTSLGSIRAIADATITADEAVYAWTPAGQIYLVLDRPAATRFDRRNWLTGTVTGGADQVQLPGVWDQTMADLVASQPRLFVELLDEPMEPTNPISAWATAGFVPIYESLTGVPARVWLRSDLAAEPPERLAFTGHGSDASRPHSCWSLDWPAVAGTIHLNGPDQRGVIELDTDEVRTGRGPTNDSETGGVFATVDTSAHGPSILLQVSETSALAWDGATVIGALEMPLGITDVTFDVGLEARAQPRDC